MSPGPSISDKIFRNTLFNAIGSLWKMGISFAITPYIIAHVGIDRYGIWALVGLLTGYFGLLDFGIGASFVKYISEFYAKGDYGRISRLISTGIVFYTVFAVAIISISYVAIDPLLGFLHIPPEMHDEVYFVFMIGIALFGATNIASAFGAIQSGLQRMDVTNKVSVIVSVPMVLGTVFFLENGYGLEGLIINNVIVFLITTLFNVYLAFRLFPELKVSLSLFSMGMLKKLFGFGYKIQVGTIADVVVFQSDKLIIAFFLTTGLVGIYQLGTQIAQTIRSLPMFLISALLPAASEVNASKSRDKLHELYVMGSKYMTFVSFPLTFFTIIMANIIMQVWMGPGYEQSAWIIQVLAVGYLANLLCGVAVTVGAAIEKPELQMNASIITVVSNLILSLLLVNFMGLTGVAVATSISLILGPIYYFIVFHREIELSLKTLITKIALVPTVASFIAVPVTAAIYYGLTWFWLPSGRIENLIVLCFFGMAFLGVYMLIVLRYKYFDSYDFDLICRYIPVGRILTKLNINTKDS